MAPVWSRDAAPVLAGVEVGEEVMRLLVGDVRVELEVRDVDVLELEVELELELVVEAELDLLELPLVVLLLTPLEVRLVVSVEAGDSAEEVSASVELGTVTVPSVVGAVSVSAVSVKLKVRLGRSSVSVIPVAVASTLVARSLAVPQPNWKKPPSNTFL